MEKPTPPGIALALLLLLVSWFSASAQGEIHFQEDFEAGPHDLWELEPGWQIEQTDQGALLAGEGHSWARLNLPLPADFRLSFRLKVLQGQVHLVTHLNDTGRYFIGIGAEPAALNKQYWPDTFLGGLAQTSQGARSNTWMEVELSAASGNLQLWIDGLEQWAYSDPEPLDGGSLAFESLENSRIQVDDLTIWLDHAAETSQADREAVVASGELAWIRTGGPLGGLGYDVRLSPDNPDKLYVTDAFAGVFISEDGGASWTPSNQGISDRTGESMDAIPVFCLTVSPHDPQVIFAGTQYHGGLYRTDDGGRSWVRKTNGITLQDGLTFRGITVDPVDPQVIYAGGEISSWAWAGEPRNGREFDLTQGVLYKSEDGGESWREVWRGDNLARYILINPQNTDIIYLSTGIFDREAANSDPVSGLPGGEGVLKSTDGGESWTQANSGLDNLYVGSLYMNPDDPEVLLAGTGNNQYWENSGIYLTTNGARSWQQVFGKGYQNINAVEFSEIDPQIAYAGDSGSILRSQDSGLTWQMVSGGENGWGAPGVRGGFPIDLQVDPRDPDRLFANNYGGGNFLSEDGGRTWQVASTGYTGAQVRSLAVHPQQPGLVYAAARSGIFLSPDGGGSWTGLAAVPNRDLEWYAVAIDPANPDHLLAANNWQSSILASQDGGRSWQRASQEPGEGYGIRIFAFAPSDPRWVYAGSAAYYSAGTFSPEMAAKGIYQSRDGGQTWIQCLPEAFSDAHVLDLAIARQDHEIIYAATSNYGVLRSLDGGASWQQTNQGLDMRRGASAVAIHPDDSEIIYAGVAFGGIYRSQDSGGSWQQISAGINPEANITDLVIDPANPHILYTADSFSGVYHTLNGGDSWQGFSQGLRLRAVNQLALSADGQHLYAATEGEGVYRFDLIGEPPQAVSVDLELAEPSAGEQDKSDQKTEGDQPSKEKTGEPEGEDRSAEGEQVSRQICPGSYLPLAAGLALLAAPRRQKAKGDGK